MCVLAVKYFEVHGWVAAKNRDRSYKPTICVKKSFRMGTERCMFWDEETKWTEGVNEHGIAILNTTLKVKKDEKEATLREPGDIFYSPGGKIIRKALLKKSVDKAVKELVDNEMEGFSLVFSKDKAILVEAPSYIDVDKDYEYNLTELEKGKDYVRTNHGIHFKNAGYPIVSDDEKMILSRKSSESRYKVTYDLMKTVKEPEDLLRILGNTDNKNPQMNPFRTSKTHGKSIMVTTGQILSIPGDKVFYYRPVWGDIKADFSKLDNIEAKTFFELMTNRKIIGVKESVAFKNFYSVLYPSQ